MAIWPWSTVILGRVAAAPVLLVNGIVLPSQADEETVEQAVSNLLDTEAVARDIGRKATEIRKALKQLQEGRLAADFTALRDLVSAKPTTTTTPTTARRRRCLPCRLLGEGGQGLGRGSAPGQGRRDHGRHRQALKKAKKVLMALDSREILLR